jgi:hypothetical protein
VGFDLIFAAPKCVSILFAAPDHEVAREVVKSHHRAVDAAVSYLEQRALSIVRTAADKEDPTVLGTDGAIGARFTHGLSRSGDPHLHSHLVLANLAHGQDGRFGAIDSLALRAHGRALDSLYRSQLRHELRSRLDVRWQLDALGHEQIDSVGDSMVVALSGRSAEHRLGEGAVPQKVSLSRREAEAIWAARARLAPEMEGRERRTPRADVIDEHRFSGVLYDRAIRSRDVVEAWTSAAGGGIESSVVALALADVPGALGRGRFERPIARSDVQPSQSMLRALGPRPTQSGELAAWWQRRDHLLGRIRSRGLQEAERHVLTGPDRGPRSIAR